MYNHNDEEKEPNPGNDLPPLPRNPREDIQNDRGRPVDVPDIVKPGHQPGTIPDPKKPAE